ASIRPEGGYWRHNDNFVATIRHEDGSLSTLTYTALGSKSHPKERAEIFVDGRVLILDDYKNLSVVGGTGGWRGTVIEKGQAEELKALARALKSGGPWPISLEEQLAATRISFAVEEQLVQ